MDWLLIGSRWITQQPVLFWTVHLSSNLLMCISKGYVSTIKHNMICVTKCYLIYTIWWGGGGVPTTRAHYFWLMESQRLQLGTSCILIHMTCIFRFLQDSVHNRSFKMNMQIFWDMWYVNNFCVLLQIKAFLVHLNPVDLLLFYHCFFFY